MTAVTQTRIVMPQQQDFGAVRQMSENRGKYMHVSPEVPMPSLLTKTFGGGRLEARSSPLP